MPQTIFFSVGEPSGDEHAARLIDEIRRGAPALKLRGFGGQRMRETGCQLDRDLTRHAVVGLVEVLPKLREFFRLADEAEEAFASGSVDAVVLVDFPGFNWHVARRAKRHGIPVFYYCPPQLWAWGRWRVRKMRRLVDHVLAVLPVEQEFFAAHDISSTLVGHPFFDAVADHPVDHRLLRRLDGLAASGGRHVAVLPGSRDHEVHRNWPLMLESIRRLARRHPEARFLVAGYRDTHCLWCRDQLSQADRDLPIEFFAGRTSEVIEASRCAMLVSGSVSLELMARRTPGAVIYRVGRLLHAVARLCVRVDSMTLPNLIAGRKLFPEFVSVGNPEPAIEFLTASVDAMLGDDYYYRQTVGELERLNRRYAQPGASAAAARLLLDRLGSSSRSSELGRRAA